MTYIVAPRAFRIRPPCYASDFLVVDGIIVVSSCIIFICLAKDFHTVNTPVLDDVSWASRPNACHSFLTEGEWKIESESYS